MMIRRFGVPIILILGLLAVPLVVESPYAIHILIMTAIYIGLVLSYDFSVGEVGTLSLVHATFFGVGGYTAGLIVTRSSGDVSFFVEILAAGAVAGMVAIIIGIPTFRLPDRSFAIGTLAFAMIAQQVVHNWVTFTRGPMCVVPIPSPRINLPFIAPWQPTVVRDYYYMGLVIAGLILLFSYRLINSRVGRAFKAVRESQTLAASLGINILKYKMLALVIGGIIAGSLGAFYAHYVRIMCPSDLSFAVIINLLIMIFVGGVGSIRGVILGAIVFNLVPELLRLAPQLRMLIYGLILWLATVFMPEGLESIAAKISNWGRNLWEKRLQTE